MQWFLSLAQWQQAVLASLMLFSLTTLGASLVFFSKGVKPALLTLMNGAAAGIMIAASFFSLLLPALSYEGFLPSYVTVTLGFLLGGGFIIVSDVLLMRRKKRGTKLGDEKNALLFLAVTLHNIPEGMAVGVAFAVAGGEHAVLSAFLLALGIGIQNFPEGLCIAFPLRAKGLSAVKSFVFSSLSGAVEIPACVLGALAAGFITGLLPWALAFSAGAMVAVVCSELIPECFEKSKTLASLGLIFGFCLMMVLDVALG